MKDFAVKVWVSLARIELGFTGLVQHMTEMWETLCPHSYPWQKDRVVTGGEVRQEGQLGHRQL